MDWVLDRPLDLSLYYIFLLNEMNCGSHALFEKKKLTNPWICVGSAKRKRTPSLEDDRVIPYKSDKLQ